MKRILALALFVLPTLSVATPSFQDPMPSCYPCPKPKPEPPAATSSIADVAVATLR